MKLLALIAYIGIYYFGLVFVRLGLEEYVLGGTAYNPQKCHYCTTPTPKPRRSVSPITTPTPTEEPWTCPVIGDLSKKDYKQACLESCKEAELEGCGKICNDCWESE